MKDQLYIMQPGFTNGGLGPLYCGDSAPVEGMLSFFPQLRELVDVSYIAFPRPRSPLFDLLGEDNQGIPVLILAEGTAVTDPTLEPFTANGHRFFNDQALIRRYLSSQFGLPQAG
jgi:hypothetical protein